MDSEESLEQTTRNNKDMKNGDKEQRDNVK
jgi:hypothetical protein